MKQFTSKDFIVMPWRNGGGITTQLFIYPDSQNFDLRLSIAFVSQNGPFSLFPGIDRHLLILSGNGCELKMGNTKIVLTPESETFTFRGEESIDCNLVDGTITDFNVMINRQWGKATLRKASDVVFNSSADISFVYDIVEKTLTQLDLKEEICIKSQSIIVEIKKAG